MGVEGTLHSVEGDLCVYGATAGGIVAAVRAARLGLSVVLVSFDEVPGGVFPSLGAVETHYDGRRAPLLSEIQERIHAHYKQTYGEQSAQYQTCRFAKAPMTTFEPHVAERLFEALIADEKLLVFYAPYDVDSAEVTGRRVTGVRFASSAGGSMVSVRAGTYIDASYTGDLVAACGVPCRIGRESRQEYGEPHAGRLFTRWVWGRYPADAVEGRLNLHAKSTTLGIMSGSSGEGDDNIMAYSYRLCLTDDPKNRVPPPTPGDYNRDDYLGIVETPEVSEAKRYALHHRWITKTLPDMIASDHLFHGHALPNKKRSWNATNFPGAGKNYPTASPAEREEIARRHINHALGILYFLQNDEAVPADIREEARRWGPAADEFTHNRNLPRQLYIREARRMIGRAVFGEHDAIQATAHGRPPIHRDSIGITDFPIDSLACTTDRMPGSTNDGQYFLQELSRPGQIPFGILLPKGPSEPNGPDAIDNLLGPGAASATHVAWGTIRQTPTFMHMCESAAYAVAVAVAEGIPVADVPVHLLQRRLAEAGIMLTFFNDVDMAVPEPWLPAVQFFGTRGFFPTFDAHAHAALDHKTARLWIEEASRLQEAEREAPVAGTTAVADTTPGPDATPTRGDADRLAAALSGNMHRRPPAVPTRVEGATRKQKITQAEFAELALSSGIHLAVDGRQGWGREVSGGKDGLSRGAACLLLYEAIA